MIRPAAAALCAALLLPLAAQAEMTETLRAVGNEPFWSASVGNETFGLSRLGFDDITLPVTEVTGEGAASIIVAHDPAQALRAVLAVDPGICRDSMTGMPYPAAATLSLGDAVLEGCAGDPARLLTAGEWRVVTIGDAPVVEGSAVSLVFDSERLLSGSTGCNRMTGGYTLTGEGLTLGPIATTRMACAEALMAQEMTVAQALDQVTRFDIDTMGQLVLIAGDTPLMVAAPAQ